MSKPKYWGTIRKVLTGLSNQFISVNEDMSTISIERARREVHNGSLFPRLYTFPEMEINIKCNASISEGKVKLFGLDTKGEENSVEINIRAPFTTQRLTVDQLDQIIKMNDDEARKKLEERGIETDGNSFFIPDEE